MNSIINQRHIPDDECWVWPVHEQGRTERPYYYVDEQHDHCGVCQNEVQELFELKSPVSNGFWWLCHSCIMKLAKFIREGDCPVCGFGVSSFGGDRMHVCIFDHEWDYEGDNNTGRKIIITPKSLKPTTVTALICPYCDQWNDLQATECSSCGNKLQ